MFSIGIDIGYSTVKVSVIDKNKKHLWNRYRLHKGQVINLLVDLLDEVLLEFGAENIEYGALSGNGSKRIVELLKGQFIEEVPALVEASQYYNDGIKTIIHIGGQNSKCITCISGDNDSHIEIGMNSNCAAGTGAFLEEQVSRLNLELEDYSFYASRATQIPRIAGRCSVFAKTDITHHQQEGASIDDILLGLSYAVVRNFKSTVVKKMVVERPIMLTGGVAFNEGVIIAIKDLFNLKNADLVISDDPINDISVGVSIIALEKEKRLNLEELLDLLKSERLVKSEKDLMFHLSLDTYLKDDSKGKHNCQMIDGRLSCYLGIDIGSTSTNLVLIDKYGAIIAYEYIKTYGEPVVAIQNGLKRLKRKVNEEIEILGTGITGSGRYLVGRLLKVDIIKDEITSQAKAALAFDPTVDTIFEIGGQDSKYISLKNGVVVDFQMNKICAAGTGSFIEEQANKFEIPIEEFGEFAMCSKYPVELGDRCTVFIESSISSCLSKGVKISDIASGLCYSIAQNYLNKVVGKKAIGQKVFFQGGVAFNQGVVSAFRNLLGDKIVIPPFFSVTGAYGVALIASEEMIDKSSTFIGFNEEIVHIEEILESNKEVKTSYDKEVKQLIFGEHDMEIDSNKKTIGIPRALFTFGMFPFFKEFFESLDFNILLSSESNEKTVADSQEFAMEETCFPLKLLNGHVVELLDKKVDYLLIPDLFTADHPESKSRKNYGCVYMQSAFKMINQTMSLEERGVQLLAPTFAPNIGDDFMKETFIDLGEILDRSREDIVSALDKSFKVSRQFKKTLEENAKRNINGIDKNKLTFVIVSKIYGVLDPILNVGVAGKLESMGYNVISFTDLMSCDIFDDYENMYWPFSQHILGAAKYISEQANMYAVFLTHHGCGPDSVVSHYFRSEMKGKPYLNIEVDEHASDVGVITRVEAFVNSLESVKNKHKTEVLYLPYMYPYADLVKEVLNKKGRKTEVLPMTCKRSLELGRQFTSVQEYYSLTALMGDVFKKIKEKEDPATFMIYRTEGAEVEGQYSRMIKMLLDEDGLDHVKIEEPFLEDLIELEIESYDKLCLCLLAGDIMRVADIHKRKAVLEKFTNAIQRDDFTLPMLIKCATEVSKSLVLTDYSKSIYALGESTVLFNDFLNNHMLSKLEEENHKIVYHSLAESMYVLWSHSLKMGKNTKPLIDQRLEKFKKMIEAIAQCFNDISPFEEDITKLEEFSQEAVGYFSAGNGRYRAAKLSTPFKGVEGIVSVNSMYENTGISLNMMQKGFNKQHKLPILNLVFDGNKNDNEDSKLSSFLYYL